MPQDEGADARVCVTCGQMGGVCRWVDDPVICMRGQIAQLRQDVEDALAAFRMTGPEDSYLAAIGRAAKILGDAKYRPRAKAEQPAALEAGS